MSEVSKEKLLRRILELENELEDLKSESPEGYIKRWDDREKDISRRDFLKNVGVGVSGIGAFAFLPSVSAFNIRSSNPIQYFGSGSSNPDFAVQTNGSLSASSVDIGSNGSVKGISSQAIAKGKVFSDDGSVYDTVQAAVDNASNYVKIGPGVFNEAVTIKDSGLSVEGSGYNTVIDGGTSGEAFKAKSSNVSISNLSVRTLAGGGADYHAIELGNTGSVVRNVQVLESDGRGINMAAKNSSAINCVAKNTDSYGITMTLRSRVIGCRVIDTGNNAISGHPEDAVIKGNIVRGPSGDGVYVGFNGGGDNVVLGNRLHNCSGAGVRVSSADNIVANNRISGSGGSNIDGNGSTLKDGNLTGAAN